MSYVAMLTVDDREILAVVAVGYSITVIVGFLAMVISGACKMRKGQQEAANGCRAPPRSNGVGEDRPPPTATEAAAVGMEEMEIGRAAVQARPLLCRYLKADGWQDTTCGVCLAELADGDALRVLPPCMHYFHDACVGDWIRVHATCPFCRGPVAAAPLA
jgi:hypothetical protein